MFAVRPVSALTTHEYNLIPESYRRARRCLHCGDEYRELDNIGRLCCLLHPGILRLDSVGTRYVYSCCSVAYPHRGCCRADHMDCALVGRTEAERHTEIAEFAIKVVPTVLFQYGHTRPLNESMLYNGVTHEWTPDGARPAVYYRLPFDAPTDERRLVILEEEHRGLCGAVADSPLLHKLYATDDKGSAQADLMDDINNGWRETLDKPRSTMAAGEIDATPEYIIPFVVICRVKR